MLRIAAIDYGTRRIGIAISDPRGLIASPLAMRQRGQPEADAKFFQELAQREGIGRFVVGLPIHLSGDESQKSREARQFGTWLNQQTGIEVVFFDERFTTREANELLAAGSLSRKQRGERRDMLAAQVLLNAYLESGDGGTSVPSPLDDPRSPLP